MSLLRILSRHHLRLALLLATVFAISIAASAQQRDPRVKSTLRDVSGVITDSSHEPVRGAIVELENPADHVIISFITTDDGHYVFHRLDSHIDFQIWASFRGHKSAIHNISMYDDHLDKIINIVVKTY